MAVRNITEQVNPFLDGESAIAALRDHIDKDNRIMREGMYLLEIINQLTNEGAHLSERIPQEVLGGLSKGGRRNVQASALLRTEGATDVEEQNEILPSGYTRSQEIIGQWAERDGCWSDTPEADQIRQGRRHRLDLDGSEARIYYDNGARVYKTVDSTHYITYAHFLDRITIHNALFPETAMRIEGFGVREDAEDNRGFVAVISQPFVKGEAITDPAVVHQAMRKRGLDLPDFTAGWFFVPKSGNLLISDVHDNNCVLSDDGNVLVFDCEAALNDMPAFNGKWRIGPLDYNPESVAKIHRELRGMVPESVPRSVILDLLNGDERESAKDELATAGRLEKPVKLDNGATLIVQSDPEREGYVLVSTPDKISRLMRLARPDEGDALSQKERETLISGLSVTRDGKRLAFNLDKGRIDTFRIPKMRLRIAHKSTLSL